MIEKEFRVNIFLDTNILIYLVDEAFENMKMTITFLKNCPSVDLYTSEYALAEFINERKREYYLRKLVYEYKINLTTAFNYHKEFNADEVSFDNIKEEIKTDVEKDIEMLRNFGIITDLHQLSPDLLPISKEICLLSKLSIYDSMVVASSLNPYCELVLTNDANFGKFFNESNLTILFDKLELSKPTILSSKNIEGVNLTKNDENNLQTDDNINQIWIATLTNTLKCKRLYLGQIFTEKCASKSSSIICFTLEANKTLVAEMFLVVVTKNLSEQFASKKITGFSTEDGQLIQDFPFCRPEQTKISFYWHPDISISEVRKNNNLLFISPSL